MLCVLLLLLMPVFFVELVKEGKMVWCFFLKKKVLLFVLSCHVILFFESAKCECYFIEFGGSPIFFFFV